MISRRKFIKIAGITTPIIGINGLTTGISKKRIVTGEMPIIKKITAFKATGSFDRFISMNAYDKRPKGINGINPFIMIELSDGTVGIGPGGYSAPNKEILNECKKFIGMNPFSFYTWNKDKITGVAPNMNIYFYNRKFAWIEAPILDAIGKVKKEPVWNLMGDKVRDNIDPYNSTIYFEDIAYNTNASIIGMVGLKIKNEGYKAIKMKVGRPFKWLPGEAGLERDIEAFIALREAVGNNFILMADANCGYRDHFNWAVRLARSCAKYNVFFMEEIFPERISTSLYRKMQELLLKDNFFIPIAEGEDIKDLSLFDTYYTAGVYNYIQPDMASSGMSNVLLTAKKAEKYPHVKIAPHVWQNQLGTIMSMHISKIQNNIPIIEDSCYFDHIIDTSAYQFKDGQYLVPDKPGWGVDIVPDHSQYKVGSEMTIS